MEAIEISEKEFKAKLSDATGILMFYKKLCPNSRALERMIEKFLAANPHITYMRINSEECPKAMEFFETTRVPTTFLLRDGEVIGKKVGLMNVREMTELYESTQD